MARCEGCRFWSDRVAEASGEGHILALCLHPSRAKNSFSMRMTHAGCAHHERGISMDAQCSQCGRYPHDEKPEHYGSSSQAWDQLSQMCPECWDKIMGEPDDE